MIRRVFAGVAELKDYLRVVYLENYDINLAKFLVAGVDLWLNTLHRPEEASGTSGMKAALNGVPSLSILDGWWIEKCFEGWAIGEDSKVKTADNAQKLHRCIKNWKRRLFQSFIVNRNVMLK